MANSSSSSPVKICRKCKGTCPPCRPWRCKFGKGRTLEECENDMQKRGPVKLKRSNSAPIAVYGNTAKPEGMTSINRALSTLSLRDNISGPPGIAIAGEESSSEKSSGAPPGFVHSYASNDDTSSSGNSGRNTASTPPAATYDNTRRQIPLFNRPLEQDTSHIFLAIAADPALVRYSETVLSHVIQMPDVPEITSYDDSRCIWPHTVHLTIYSFGKVLNVDIPSIADYCKKNIEVIEPFDLHITGMFHHEKLHTIGYAVEKETVEPLRQIKMNMSKWFNKTMCWNSYLPILSLLRTRAPFGAKYSCAPVTRESIDIILQNFGGVRHLQEIIPARDIQLCLARSSTETTFYKNLLV